MKKVDAFNPEDQNLVIVPRGSGGGGKGGGSSGGSTEDPTSLQSNQIVSLIDLVCEGPVVGLADGTFQSVLLNNTPYANSDGTTNFQIQNLRFNTGYPNQAPLPGLSDAEQVFQLNQKIIAAVPYSFQLSANSVDAVVITAGVQGLLQTDTGTGDIHGSAVAFHVDIKPFNGAFQLAFADTISGKTSGVYNRDYRLELPQSQGPWTVRVTRDTPDSASTTTINDFFLAAYTEIGELNLSYPYSCVFGWQVSAQQFGTSIPSRSYKIKGMIVQIPSNYDPINRSYAGAYWDGTFVSAWTDNPAWVMYDIMTNSRYGLGKRLDPSLIDKYSLYAIAQYCDQYVPDGFGGYEPRFRFNGILSQASDAYQVLQSIASTMRGMIYWSAGAVTFTQDSPKTMKKLFAPANVIDGKFDYQSTALKDRHSVARVIWNDPANHCQQAVEVVEHPDAMQRFGWRSVDIQAIGTTSRGQANRIGKWMLDTEFSEAETVSFTCSLQECDLLPGDLIDISDPAVAGGRFGGRIVSNVGTALTLDAPVTLYGSDIVMAMAPDGVSVWQVAVGSADGLNPTKNLAMASPFSAPLTPASMFLMSSPAVAPRQFRCVSITETAINTWAISALYYDAEKFDRIEQGINLPEPSYSVLPTGPMIPPSNISVKESLFQMNGTIVSRLIVSWTASTDPRVSGYDVFAASPGGNMQWFGRSTVTSFDIDTAQLGGWTFNIYSSSVLGDSFTPAVFYYTVLGKNLPPSDVENLTYQFDPTIGVVLTWQPVADVDLALYEVRKMNQYGDNFSLATYLGQVKGSNFTLPPGGKGGGGGTYMVKAVSIVGNESTNAAEVLVVVPQADAPVITGSFVGDQCVFSWNVPAAPFAIDFYEVRTDVYFGDLTDTTQMLGQVKGNTISTKAQWIGPRNFLIAAFDVAGDYGKVGLVTMTIKQAAAPAITASVIDNNVLLRWTDVPGTLPIDHYEIRKGSVWATAGVVGNTSGTFDVLFETASGTYTYWIAAVDTAGNYGIPSNCTATVSQPPDYILLYNYNSTFGGTQVNTVIDGDGGLILPVDITSTFEQHFTNNRVVSATTFDPVGWSTNLCTIQQNATDDPDGNINAYTVTTAAAGNDYFYKTLSGMTAGVYTYSIFLRRRTGKGSGTVSLRLRDSTGATEYAAASFALTTAWQRFSITGTLPTGATGCTVYVDSDTVTGNSGFVLDVAWPQLSSGSAVLPYWGNPNDQVNAGFKLFIEPGASSASYQEFTDYGTHLPSTKFTVTPTQVIVDGAPVITCDIQVSLDGVTWTDYPDTFQTFVTNFRYAKTTITVTGNGGDLVKFTGLNIRFDVKQKTDGGIVQCLSTDVGGTLAYLTAGFIDVQSLTVTGQGTVAAFAIYDFVDIPYPDHFSIYLFDKNGNRLSGNASWAARGV